MTKTVRTLLLSALALVGGGWTLYHIGSQINLTATGEDAEQLWDQAPGDIWRYVGGLLLLIAGSLVLAAFRLWREGTKGAADSPFDGLGDH